MKQIILIAFFLKVFLSFGQPKELDTTYLRFNAKMLLLADSYRLMPRTAQEVENFMDSNANFGFEFIESSGFKEHIFIRMVFPPIQDSLAIETSLVETPDKRTWFLIYPYTNEFIIAYNTRTSESFRLKGFYTIDSQEFLDDLSERAIGRKEYFMIKKKRLKQFEKKFLVEGLEWDVLFH